jgi:type I restriction enzyme, S subunit
MEENQVHIPDGWKLNELGNLIKEQKKSSLKVSDAANFGEFPFFTSGEAILKHTSKQLDGKNIFLATGGVANIKYYEGDAAYSTDTYAVTTKDEIDTEYLYFDLLNILYYINANYFQGSGLKHLQKKDLKKHQILFPESPTEQTTIARILSKVDESIAQTEQLIAKYTRIKTGLMQDLLTKGIDEHGNIRSEQTHEFKDSPLGRIPKEWEVKRLDQMTKSNSPIVYGILMPGKHFFGGIPVVKVKDIFDEKIHFEDLLLTNPKIALAFKRSELMKDDLLFTIRGTVGRCAFVPVELEGANITQDTARIRVKNEYKEYVRYAFETPDSKFYIQLNTIGQAVKGINLKALRELNILVPPPNEAQLIAKELNTANNVLSGEATNLKKLQSLKTGLMQDLLSGKVRVNHLIKETAIA